MAKELPKTIRLKDYTAPDYSIDSVNLIFDLAEEHSTVTATLLLRIKTKKVQPLPVRERYSL